VIFIITLFLGIYKNSFQNELNFNSQERKKDLLIGERNTKITKQPTKPTVVIFYYDDYFTITTPAAKNEDVKVAAPLSSLFLLLVDVVVDLVKGGPFVLF